MMNPLYFDQATFNTGEIGKAIASHRSSFVRQCAQEWSLENYIAYCCLGAFRKSPSLIRLQTFYVTFLKGKESPMEINVSKTQAASVVTMATSVPSVSGGFTQIGGPPSTALDALDLPIQTNLTDTYGRLSIVINPQFRYKNGLFGRLTGQLSKDAKTLKKAKTSDSAVILGLNILEGGGFPVRHMGLTGVVQGF